MKTIIHERPIFHFATRGGVFCRKSHDFWNHEIDKIFRGFDAKVFKDSPDSCAECVQAIAEEKEPKRKISLLS